MKWVLPLVVVAVVFVIISVFALDYFTIDKSCNADSDCVLRSVSGPCGPCDHSDPDIQCVSLEEAEELQNRWGTVFCAECLMSPVLYRCVCEDNQCVKTASCNSDNDCWHNYYSCIDNECRLNATE